MTKKLSKEVLEQRIKNAGAGRYEFIRWSIDGEFGTTKKCVAKCIKDGYEWSAKSNDLAIGGVGCPQCAGKRKWNEKERIEQINDIKDVEFVCFVDSYKSVHSKVNVRCKVDGFVWSAAVNDLVNGGKGCPHCAGVRRWKAEERIEQINSLENIEFISFVDSYIGANSKAKVRCIIDGFAWSASIHSLVNNVSGCPRCAKYGYQLDKKGYLYALRSECGKYVKVGISNEPRRRHNELEKRTPFKFNLIEQISGDGDKIYKLEKHFHNKYESAGFTGFDGCTEWLVCSNELLSELRGLSIEHE